MEYSLSRRAGEGGRSRGRRRRKASKDSETGATDYYCRTGWRDPRVTDGGKEDGAST